MKALFYRYGSICEEGFIKAFREYGIEPVQITKEMTEKSLLPSDCVRLVSSYLDNGDYTFVFSINFFPTVSDVCKIFNIPYMCIIVDSPVLELYSPSLANPCNRVFLFDKCLYNEFEHVNPGKIYHIPLCTDVDVWDSAIASAPSGRYCSDVAFVGSLYTEKDPYALYTGKPEYLDGYLTGLIEAQLKVYGYYFIDEVITEAIAKEFLENTPNGYRFPESYNAPDPALVSQFYLGNHISAVERVRLFKRISERFNVDIYTASDTGSLPHIHNRGLAKTLTEMPVIFNRAGININPTSKAIRSGLPLRLFDLLGCRAFTITNYQSELTDIFTIGEHLEIYESLDDLEDKITFYLDRPDLRKEIAMAGYEEVKAKHTYTIRLGEMISLAFSAK